MLTSSQTWHSTHSISLVCKSKSMATALKFEHLNYLLAFRMFITFRERNAVRGSQGEKLRQVLRFISEI